MKKPSAVSSTVDWNHDTLEPFGGKVRKPGLAASMAWNIVADAAVIVERQIDAEEQHDAENQDVLHHRIPRRAAHARHDHVDRHDGAPIQTASVDEIAPYDAVATMMPSPLSCSTR